MPLPAGAYQRIKVSDNGSGMSAETIQKVFRPFFTTSKTGEGSGLGLTIVQRIIHDHAGGIEATSVLGAGTTFSIFLPVARDPVEPAEGAHLPPIGAAPGVFEVVGSGECVLFVDDEAIIGRLVKRLLTALGFTPCCVEDGRLALEMIRSQPEAYDVLISDVRMPALSGIELARSAAYVRRDLPILLLTGQGVGSEVELLDEGLVQAILRKPIDAAMLGEAISKALGLRGS